MTQLIRGIIAYAGTSCLEHPVVFLSILQLLTCKTITYYSKFRGCLIGYWVILIFLNISSDPTLAILEC